MEQNKSKETETEKSYGVIAMGATLVVGYILGHMGANQIAVEAYRRGVSDTLNFYGF